MPHSGQTSGNDVPMTNHSHRTTPRCLVPCRSCHFPGRKQAFQVSRLDQVRHRMFPLYMIDAVLWSALPLGAPCHRAPPQLGQVDVKTGYMSRHIVFNVCATIRETSHPYPTKVLFTGMTKTFPDLSVSGTYRTLLKEATAIAGETSPPRVHQARPPPSCREE